MNNVLTEPGVVQRQLGRASDALAERLAALIAAGEFEEGDRLPPERDLMQRYGVSRTVVREAIASLANRGLLHTRPGFRPIVRRPDYDRALDTIGQFVKHLLGDEAGVHNLFETRIFIESGLARAAARNARKQDIEELGAALERNRAAIGDGEAFYDTDVAFHAVLYRIPRNPIYPVLHKAYVEWLIRHWCEMPRAADIDRLNFAGHAAVFEAIVGRDPDAAEQAMRRHLEVAWELVRSTFPNGTEAASAGEATGSKPDQRGTRR
jgi:GntR family transcriptional regulator, sialic acid-inducible nan operon repressor